MTLVKTVFNKSWIPYENRVDFYLGSKVEFDAPVTTVHGFFFNEKNKLLLVEHCRRGWEIPGGHIDTGEGYEAAMRRELFEEAQMEAGELILLGHLEKSALEAKPHDCKYPYPLSYCLFYSGRITSREEFCGDESIVNFKFIDIKESRENAWIQSYEVYLDEALKLVIDL